MSDPLSEAFKKIDLSEAPSPCHVLHRGLLENNLKILRGVMDRSGAKIILALKGFAQFSEAKLIRQYLAGTTASGINEALLGREEFDGEVHAYSPASKTMSLFSSSESLTTFHSIPLTNGNAIRPRLKPRHARYHSAYELILNMLKLR